MAENELKEQEGKQEVETAEGVERMRERRAFVPRSDIYETDEAYYVVADMPGVGEQQVDVTIEKNLLTLVGHVEGGEVPGKALAYAEYEVGDYERTFTVSEGIDREKIDATMRDGVLYLTLPKAGPAKTKRIEVRAG